MESDKKATDKKANIYQRKTDELANMLDKSESSGNILAEIQSNSVYCDYPDTFDWMKLFHKLCFEQLLENFSKLAIPRPNDEESKEIKESNTKGPFKMLYEYISKFGDSIEVLRIPSIDKHRLKSNHFWIMPLLTKLENLRAIKMHLQKGHRVGPDFFNFFKKANAKLAEKKK